MEVHHHPHHVSHKKKWGEYLLEFIMLFLAVFLGFVAENVRENITDNHKEKEYMSSMLLNVRRDTLMLNALITVNNLLIAGQDSTLHFLAGNLKNQDTSDLAIIYYFKYCQTDAPFSVNDATISQLKSGGGLRLIRNKDVVREINTYYTLSVYVTEQASSVKQYVLDNAKQAGTIFNYLANREFIDSAALSQSFDVDIPVMKAKQWMARRAPTMLTTDEKTLAPFMQNISFQMGLMQNYRIQLEFVKTRAIKLMQTIQENYHLAGK